MIEIGTGGARDAPLLIQRGYGYVGSDISLGLIRLARKKLPGVQIVHQSVYELDFGSRQFDGFWASAVLLHIPRTRIDEALTRIRTVLRGGGIGFISLKEGNGEALERWEGADSDVHGRLFVYYSREAFTEILKQNNFEIIDFIYHPMSEKTTWLCFFVRKIPDKLDEKS